MKLNLVRPIIFFDIEATGLNPGKDRIVEMSYIKVFPDNHEESDTLRFNPEMPISAEASAVNGITDADVANCPTFKERAHDLNHIFEGSDIAGFNSNDVDIPMLVEEFLRAGINFDLSDRRFIDVQNIYHKMEPRNLVAAYAFYCQKDLKDAHTAMADTRATYEVLLGQLDRYADKLQNDVAALSAFSSRNRNVDLAGRIVLNDKNQPVFNFGKYKGQPVAHVFKTSPGYYAWLMQGDFPQNTKQAFIKIKLESEKQ